MKRVTLHAHQFGEGFCAGKELPVVAEIHLLARFRCGEPELLEICALPGNNVDGRARSLLKMVRDRCAETAVSIENQGGHLILRQWSPSALFQI